MAQGLEHPARGPRIFYGWIVLLLCFMALVSNQGIRSSVGAYIVPWEQDFNITRAIAGAVSTVGLVIYALMQPVVGRLSDRLGARPVLTSSLLLLGGGLLLTAQARELWQLYLFLALTVGIGAAGSANVVAVSAMAHWFVARRGLVVGLAVTGMSVGQMLLTPLSINLIDAFGWRYAATVLGWIALGLAPVLLIFMRSDPAHMGLTPYGAGAPAGQAGSPGPFRRQDGTTAAPTQSLSLWKDRAFWYLVIPYFFCGYTTAGMMATHLVPFARELGQTAAVTSTAVAVMSACTAVGALISGPLSDRFSRGLILGALYSLRLLSLLLAVTWVSSPLSLVVFTSLFGLTDYATIAPTMAAGTDLFGRHRVGVAAGMFSFSHQAGSALGALVPGVLFDLSGSYHLAFLTAIAGMLVAASLSFLLPRRFLDGQAERPAAAH